jgi:hypothetical protein
MKGVHLFLAAALALPCLLLGQTCTITSPTASQLILAAAPVQLTATISSAPTAYSLEYDVDYRRWRKAYNADQHPRIGDFGDNWQGPWVATWYSGLYGDGPHVVSGILRDIFGNILATCPTVNFTVNIEGMANNSINLLPNLSGNTISGTGALGILTFDGINRGTSPFVDGRPINLPSGQLCGTSGTTSQSPQVPGTGGSQVPNLITTCGFTNGLHLISYGYNQTGITDPYVLSSTIASVSGTSIAFSPWHFSTQTTATNPDVVTFATTGTQYTGVNNGSQWYWQSSPSTSNTVSQTLSGSTIVLTTSAAHGATSGTPIYVRNLGYTNQSTGVNGCDGLYSAASGTSGTTINLAQSTNPTCPNGTVTAGSNANPATITLSGTLPAVGDYIILSGLTGTGWSTVNGQVYLLSQVSAGVYTFAQGGRTAPSVNSSGFGTFGAGTFAAALSYTGNLEVDINPYFTNWIDAQHISVSALPSGSSPITLSGSCTGTCTVNQRIRSPYWTGANSQVSVQNGTDYAKNGGPALVTKQVIFSNGAGTPMEIRPPYWEYHGWPGKTGDTLAAVIENTDLSSTACGSGCSYSVIADGTVTGAISVNASTGAITYAATSSWSSPSAPTAWAKATVTCTTCNVGITSVTVYIEEDPGSAPVYPHWTTCGTIATSFTTGPCHSFFPLSIQSVNLDPGYTPAWIGPAVYQNGHFNSALVGMSSSNPGSALVNPTSGSCPSWPDTYMTAWESFATTYGIRLDYDLFNLIFNFGNGWGFNGGGLPVILANTGYNRQACLTGLMNHIVTSQLYWRFHHDDEVTDIFGAVLRMTPTIQNAVNTTYGSGLTSIVVSGTAITFNVTNPGSLAGNWSQSAGTGAWIHIVNSNNATCSLSGWYPILSQPTGEWTSNNINSCANGTYSPGASSPFTETGAQVVINPSPLGTPGVNNQQNISALPSNLSAVQQGWSSALTSIGVSSCAATVNWTGNAIPNGTAIRIWGATTANLNIVAPITSGTNSFTFTYPNIGTGEACPANGTYTSSTDSGLYITVDPNWGPDPMGSFYSIINAVSGHPAKSYSMLGSFYSTPASVYSYEGKQTNTESSYVYVANAPYYYLGDSAGVFQWMNSDTLLLGNGGGLSTRALMLKPRSVLWPWGVASGGASMQTTCRSFTFNPGCDRPDQLIWRPEDIIAEIMGQKTHDYAALVNYDLMADTLNAYSYFCCGWQAAGVSGTGNSPTIAPKAFAAAAFANAQLTLDTDTELQPEANKPYFGPYFTTDAHTSATYGNELQIVCGSESPYGEFPVTLPQISGGTMLKYILTGYSLSMTVMAGNPTTDTDEFCGMPGNPTIAAPGRTTTYVALPASPATPRADNITFAPPATLPFSASKFLVQVGYYLNAMQDDPVTDCTTPCMIAIDHHNLDAYYRVIYADSNDLPRSIGDPVKIPNQGLF